MILCLHFLRYLFNFTRVICFKRVTTLPVVVEPLELHKRYRVFEQAVVFLGVVFQNWASLVLHFLYRADVRDDTFEVEPVFSFQALVGNPYIFLYLSHLTFLRKNILWDLFCNLAYLELKEQFIWYMSNLYS